MTWVESCAVVAPAKLFPLFPVMCQHPLKLAGFCLAILVVWFIVGALWDWLRGGAK